MTDIHARQLFGSASDREKEAERQQLAADLAAFQKAGGKVQTLGNSPIDKSTITRRQVVEGGIEDRKGKKGKRA